MGESFRFFEGLKQKSNMFILSFLIIIKLNYI